MSAQENLDRARDFLAAYWRADLSGALACCAPGATIELAKSLPLPTPAPPAAGSPAAGRSIAATLRCWRRTETDSGCACSSALADLIAVNGNPLDDLSLLQDQGRHLAVIMKGGAFFKRTL